jgi:hypothetical protein
VHLDRDLIEQYLANLSRILKPGGNVAIHYSDKTKIMAPMNPGFSDNTPAQMRDMIRAGGFRILDGRFQPHVERRHRPIHAGIALPDSSLIPHHARLTLSS